MHKCSVALIALDGQSVPGWVYTRMVDEGIAFTVRECATREELANVAGDADVVWVFGSHRVLTAENLDIIPRCGAIIRTGSGTDNIPVAEATARGIIVVNTPDALTDAVADHTIGLLFAVARQIVVQDRAVRGGTWQRTAGWPRLHLAGATLGLVGFGRIPQRVVHRLRGYDLRVLAFDPHLTPEAVAVAGAAQASLEQVLSEARVVSIHCPLSAATHHLIGERELRLMRSDAILINTARGPVVDEQALTQALREGWIAAAGLDVLEQEPPPADNPLLTLPNVVITPHIAAYSDLYLPKSWELSVEAAVDLARRYWPRSYVNPGVRPRWALAARPASS